MGVIGAWLFSCGHFITKQGNIISVSREWSLFSFYILALSVLVGVFSSWWFVDEAVAYSLEKIKQIKDHNTS